MLVSDDVIVVVGVKSRVDSICNDSSCCSISDSSCCAAGVVIGTTTTTTATTSTNTATPFAGTSTASTIATYNTTFFPPYLAESHFATPRSATPGPPDPAAAPAGAQAARIGRT